MGQELTVEALADLVGSIYEAAADPVLWPRFLERFGRAMSVPQVPLRAHDLARHVPHFDTQAIRLLLPHLQRASSLHRVLAERRAVAEGGVIALDVLPTGVWLFDGDGRVVHANRAATRIATRQNGLWVGKDGLPVTADAVQSARLQAMVADAAAHGPTERDGGGVLLVKRTGGAQPLHVLITAPPRSTESAAQRIRAIALLSDASAAQARLETSFASAYRLTQAETRLVAALAAGVGVKEYAAASDRSEHTVRAQLKSVMAKLGVRRQADIVRVMLAVPRVETDGAA